MFSEECRWGSLLQRSEMHAEFLVGKPENRVENLGVGDMKMSHRKEVYWIPVAHGRDQWATLMKTAMNISRQF